MSINLLVVPQVIPHDQYLEHLEGAFDSSEDTVRAFASLSLARLHPDVTSWRTAAKALNMPGPMGVRLARDHARQRGRMESADLAAGEETKRRDYRATEPRSSTGSK